MVRVGLWCSRGSVSGVRFFCRASHGGGRVTRHPHLGNCTATFGSLLVTAENKAVVGGRELMRSRRGAVGRSARKRVDPSRVARESGIRAADTNARGVRCLSGLCSVCPVLPDAFQQYASQRPEPSHSEAGRGYGCGSRPVKPRSAKRAERLAAALRSGALTGRAHTRKALPLCSGSLSDPAGRTMR